MTNVATLYSSLLDKSKEASPLLRPSLVKNLLIVGRGSLVKERVNLHKIKNQVGPLVANQPTLPAWHYRRLTRFFDDPLAKRELWKWLLVWLPGYIRRWDGRSMSLFLTLDATSWQWGQTRIQLLMLSLVYRGIRLPLCWVDLAKKGIPASRSVNDFCGWPANAIPWQGFACWLPGNTWAGSGLLSWRRGAGLHHPPLAPGLQGRD